jgi:hypothetical protein
MSYVSIGLGKRQFFERAKRLAAGSEKKEIRKIEPQSHRERREIRV